MKSIIKFFQAVQLFLYKSSKRYKSQNVPFDFFSKVQQASKIVVCMPTDSSHLGDALRAVQQLEKIFPHWYITIILHKNIELPHMKKINVDVIVLTENDVSKSGKPKKPVLQKIQDLNFDMAIDMSMPFNFTNLVVTWQCGAGLRVGFYHLDREDLYNFVLRHKAGVPLENSYHSLVSYLQFQ